MVLTPEAGGETNLVAMARSPNGMVWIARDGQVSALDHGQLKTIEFVDVSTQAHLQGIGSSRDGGLWILSHERMRKRTATGWGDEVTTAPWGNSAVLCMLETREGNFAAGTSDQGLFLVSRQGESTRFSHTNGFPIDWVTSLCQDREGNLWVGTGAGLVLIRKGNLQEVAPPDHWWGRPVLTVQTTSDGAVWVGTEGAGLYRYQEGKWNTYRNRDGLGNLYIWSIAEDSQGRLWAGTWGGGLFLKQDNHFSRAPGLENFLVPVPALLPAGDGGLWAGTSSGLMRYREGKWEWCNQTEGKSLRDVRAIAEDGRGAVWFGMAGGGLARLKDGQLRVLKKADGLSSDFVQCLHLETNGALWVGTFGGGLTRVKNGRLSSIGQEHGLANMVICDIQEDDLGFFWLSSHGGILRVSQRELNECADTPGRTIRCLTFGRSEGLPTLQCSGGLQPAGCRTADGRLWFATTKGLVVLDPRNVARNPWPPSVVIEDFLIDGRRVNTSATAETPLSVPPGRNRLEFRFTGLSFTGPEKVRFRYRLAGLDTDWVDAGTRRIANYSYIPPGAYTFSVMACNNNDVWNETGASLSFTMLPHFWQTWWFRSLALAAVGSSLASLVWFETRRRMRRKLERLERQRAVEHERARIAKDIHDDLGASLTRITLLSQSARGELDNPAQAAANLDRIYVTARELTRAMDEIVWAVNPRHDTLDSLASYLGKYAQDYLRGANIRCRLLMPVSLPARPLSSDQRHNLFLAFKESLHNVVKHSGATQTRVTLEVREKDFILTVEDNGRGFPADAAGRHPENKPDRIGPGNGLHNMQLRLSEISGRCEIQPAPDGGTQVRFVVPVRPV